MGKPKKGKSNVEVLDSDDEMVEDSMADNGKLEPTKGPAPVKKDKKKKNKGKGKDEDDWEELESKVKTLSLDGNDEDEEDDSPAPAKANKKAKKAKGLSAFELLGNMDGDDSDDRDEDKEDQKDRGSEDEGHKEKESKTKKKEKKKKEKPKKAEDEDIDAILANLEKPAAKPEKKKGKKKNKQDDDNEDGTIEVAGENTSVDLAITDNKVVTIDDMDDEYESDKKKKKKKKKQKDEPADPEASQAKQTEEEGEQNEDEDEGSTVKSAAQKKKEKKERERQKKAQEKQKEKKKIAAKEEGGDGLKDEEGVPNEGSSMKTEAASHEDTPETGEPADDAEDKGKEGKKKKKKKGEKEKEEEKKPKVNKKLAALKEHLQKVKEEEQRRKEEEERLQREEEERIQRLEEQKRLEEERKKRKKQQKKEREERLKKEGKFLTEKQKQDKRRLEQMLEAMKASGVDLPSKEDVPRKKPVYGKKKKAQDGQVQEKSPSPSATTPTEEEASLELPSGEEEIGKADAETVKEEAMSEEEVKDAWDAESEEEDEDDEEGDDEEDSRPAKASGKSDKQAKEAEAEESEDEDEEESDEEEDDDDEEEDESSEEEESESEDDLTPAERGREKIQKRAEKADKLRTTDKLRAPVVCVLGHVDTGKTKILDKLRRTNVQDGEAGGITQQIGATNVPQDAIQDKTKMVKEFAKQELKIPGLLIIDTPGHESFSNLRLRGSSLCDIAILVIDIMHGLEPQTIESINLLKERKTPFVVALNKIDRLYQWKPQPNADVVNTIKKQHVNTKAEFEERARHVIVQLAEEGLNAALYYENKNPKEYISLIPTSAHSGDGMGNLVALVCDFCQNRLAKRLMYSTELQATVMEVKAITGMGTTIDVILINGSLNEGDTIVFAGTEGPIVTQIRGLLMPQPMKELRVKSQYEHHKTVIAAQGVKINAKDMEKALAGLPLYVAHDNDEKEYYREEVATVLKDTLESIKVQDRGVFVQASTLGSLEALLEFLRTSKIPYAGINIGPVHKKDIMRASVMLEHDSQYAVILAFDVKVEREAQELAETLGVKIFTADIIYHLFDAFTKYRADLKKQKQEEFKNIAVFPCKLRVLPQFIFNSRDPIVIGVSVEAGFLKEGTPLCVPSKEFVDIGRVSSLELNHKPIDVARQGQEICIKILPNPGDAPKMYGRHFDETDLLVSKISRQSIDAVKDYFREEMTKPDWKLVMELKKQFEIL